MTNAAKTERPKTGWVAKKAEFNFGGWPMVAQQTRGLAANVAEGWQENPVEVYRVESGLEIFGGHLSRLCAAKPRLAVAVVEALASDRRAF